MNPTEWDDEDEVEVDGEPDDEDAIAARAVVAWTEIEGNDEFAQASREALVLIAQEALARKEARQRREAAERRAAARRVAESRAEWERALASDRAERREIARRARDTRLAAVARNRTEPSAERRTDTRPEASALREPAAAATVPSKPSMPAPDSGGGSLEPPHGEGQDLHESGPAAGDFAPDVGWEAFDVLRTSDPPEAPDRYLSASGTLSGADLAAWRARLGLTQQAAADRLGVRQGTVSKAESRSGEELGTVLREALASALERG
jgi:hypothetical protein